MKVYSVGMCPIKNNYLITPFEKQKQIKSFSKQMLPPFCGYYGDIQPVKKLYWISTHSNDTQYDNWTMDHIWEYGSKRWINASANDLLKRNTQDTINSILTLSGKNYIPSYIPSPNYGHDWGRYANYVEINPRLVAKYENGSISDGLLQTAKLLPAIPSINPSCIILSQLYPSLYNDGNRGNSALYSTNLHSGISKNLTARGLDYKMGDDEQVKVFNDLAHLLGFKTGIRMPLSAGQLKVKGRDFSWYHDEKAYIDACVWAVELGFDAIYFDSAKHIIDKNGYCGIGDLPNDKQMAYILYKVREQTGRSDLSFICEKGTSDLAFQRIGFTAGTDWSKPDNFESVFWESKQQNDMHYAAGPEVSNDNDDGGVFFEQRLNRINSCLFGYKDKKLPSFMQINDILPLSSYTSTHDAMMNVVEMSGSDAWTECERHWDGIFRTDNDARNYTRRVYEIFSHAIGG